MNRGDLILVDACVIIEAHRTNSWKALSSGFLLETVETCIVEAQTGRAARIFPPVTDGELRGAFNNVHSVSALDRANHAASCGGDLPDLDPGELDLWIHALQRKDAWLLCGPDRASMRFGCELGHNDKLVSLEQALDVLKLRKNLRNHYQRRWLTEITTEYALKKIS